MQTIIFLMIHLNLYLCKKLHARKCVHGILCFVLCVMSVFVWYVHVVFKYSGV